MNLWRKGCFILVSFQINEQIKALFQEKEHHAPQHLDFMSCFYVLLSLPGWFFWVVSGLWVWFPLGHVLETLCWLIWSLVWLTRAHHLLSSVCLSAPVASLFKRAVCLLNTSCTLTALSLCQSKFAQRDFWQKGDWTDTRFLLAYLSRLFSCTVFLITDFLCFWRKSLMLINAAFI